MKTATLQEDITGPLDRLQQQGIQLAGRGLARLQGPAAPAWLPVPRSIHPSALPHTTRSSRPEWMTLRETAFEKTLMALLAGAALSGIAYGFVCLLDLIQNWASVSSGIERML